MRADVLLVDGFDLLDVFGPRESLSAAGCDIALVHGEGPRSGLDPGRHLVDRFIGSETARDVSRAMQYPPLAATS